MSAETDILAAIEGLLSNSLNHIINADVAGKNEDINYEITTIKHSPYLNTSEFSKILKENQVLFCILSLNIQSLNAKFDELVIFLHKLNESVGCEFGAICIKETWLTDQSDVSLFKIDGYNLISQGKTCSAHGGLAINLNEKLNYKSLTLYEKSDVFEAQFIEISGSDIHKPVIIGYMYKPPRDVSKNYETFIHEIGPISKELEKSSTESILSGYYNINLLNINKKPFFNEFLNTMISHSFYPKITLPTRLTARNGTLLDNFFCKCSKAPSETKTSILVSEISDHFPYFMTLDIKNHKTPINPHHITIPKLSLLDIDNLKNKLLQITSKI